MIYNKINQRQKEQLAETNIEQTKKQEEIVDFLKESQTTKNKEYIYPYIQESTPYLQFIMSGTLSAISLIPTVKFMIFSLMLVGFYMGLFGIIIFGVSLNILDIKIPYGKQCQDRKACTIEFEIDTLFPSPVYMFYELENFHSNDARYYQVINRFKTSINQDQMMGQIIQDPEQSCKNAYLAKDMNLVNVSAAGFVYYSKYANPCGLASKYVFNDSYYIFNSEGLLDINSTQLLLPMYDNHFQRNQYFQFNQWLDVKDQRVQSWLTVQSYSSRFILWGVITTNIYQGSYKLFINNNYPLNIFDGEKSIILSSSSELGSKNLFLGGLLCGCSGSLFLISLIAYILTRKKNLSVIRPMDEQSMNQSQIQVGSMAMSQMMSMSQSNYQQVKLKQS